MYVHVKAFTEISSSADFLPQVFPRHTSSGTQPLCTVEAKIGMSSSPDMRQPVQECVCDPGHAK